MRAVTIVDGELQWNEHPDPVPGPGELLVEVEAAGVNNADLLQRIGLYPPPPGFPADIPGMELAGRVVATSSRTSRFSPGDRVMAVVGGGAQAELALVDEDAALAVPEAVAWDEAGGFPEAYETAHDALFTQCGLSVGDRVLITGAAGGVGSAVRRAELRDAVMALGAHHAAAPDEAVGLGPFDVVLELVGGAGFGASLGALATGGRLSVIGVGAGPRTEIDLLGLMHRRARVSGSTLRARPRSQKAAVAAAVEAHVVPLLASGRVRVPLVATFPLARAGDAYERFAAPGKLGKVVLLRR